MLKVGLHLAQIRLERGWTILAQPVLADQSAPIAREGGTASNPRSTKPVRYGLRSLPDAEIAFALSGGPKHTAFGSEAACAGSDRGGPGSAGPGRSRAAAATQKRNGDMGDVRRGVGSMKARDDLGHMHSMVGVLVTRRFFTLNVLPVLICP